MKPIKLCCRLMKRLFKGGNLLCRRLKSNSCFIIRTGKSSLRRILKMDKKARFKRYLLFFSIFVILGIALALIKEKLNISDSAFWKFYYTLSAMLVIGAVVFNSCYHKKYVGKMKEAIKILDDNKIDEYIKVVEQLSEKAKGLYLKTLLTVNLSVGYTELKDYKKALELLKSVSEIRMYGVLKMVHKLNLCCNYFYDGQIDAAKSIYNDNLKIFKSYRDTPIYGGNIAVIDIFMEIEKQNFELAEKIFTSAREKWDNPRLQEDFLYIEQMLANNKNYLIENNKEN